MFIIIHKEFSHSTWYLLLSSFKQIGEQKLISGFKGLNITFCCLCYHYYEIAELEFPLFLFKLLTGHGSTFHVLRSNNDFSAIDDDYITNEKYKLKQFSMNYLQILVKIHGKYKKCLSLVRDFRSITNFRFESCANFLTSSKGADHASLVFRGIDV